MMVLEVTVTCPREHRMERVGVAGGSWSFLVKQGRKLGIFQGCLERKKGNLCCSLGAQGDNPQEWVAGLHTHC